MSSFLINNHNLKKAYADGNLIKNIKVNDNYIIRTIDSTKITDNWNIRNSSDTSGDHMTISGQNSGGASTKGFCPYASFRINVAGLSTTEGFNSIDISLRNEHTVTATIEVQSTIQYSGDRYYCLNVENWEDGTTMTIPSNTSQYGLINNRSQFSISCESDGYIYLRVYFSDGADGTYNIGRHSFNDYPFGMRVNYTGKRSYHTLYLHIPVSEVIQGYVEA